MGNVLKHTRSVRDKKVKFTCPKNRTEMNMRKENHLDSLILITWYVTTSQLQFGGMFAKGEQTFPHLWYMLCFLLLSLIWAKPQRIIHTSGKAMNILKNTAYLHSPVDTVFLCENFLYEKLTQFDDVAPLSKLITFLSNYIDWNFSCLLLCAKPCFFFSSFICL